MNRAWWLTIKNRYPTAFVKCVEDFKMQGRDEWRSMMQQDQKLIDYFERKGFSISIRWGQIPHDINLKEMKYGYRLKWYNSNIQRDYIYTDRQKATYEALFFSFHLYDLQLQQKKAKAVKDQSIQFKPTTNRRGRY